MAVVQPTIFQIIATDNAGTAVGLTFEGTGSADGQVTIYDGVGNPIASGAVAHDGSFSISSGALASGAHALTLTTTDTLSNESAPTQAVTASVATGATALQSLDVSQLPDSVVVDISATSSAVTLTGNAGADTLFGNDAGDTINAGNGGNNISTGAGNDLVSGGTGGDTILSGGGNDVIHSGGNSSIDAGDGDDTITASGGDTVFGGKGSDSITGFATDAVAYGGVGGDYLVERTSANTFGITSKSTAPEFGSIATPGADSLSGVGTLLFGYDPLSGTAGASVSTADLIGLLSDADGAANSVDDSSTTGTAVHVTAHAVDGSGDSVSYQLLTAGAPFSIDSSSGVLTVSGALDHVSHPSYDLEVKATSSDGSFTRKTFTVTVTGVDVAPENTVPGAQGVNEDTNLVFGAGNGNAIIVSDADAGSGVETVTLGVLHGSLTLGSTAGLTSVSGNGSANVSLSGTIGNLNAALAGLTYRGAPDFNGSDTLTVTTNDNGNTGTGGPKSDTDTVAITINIVNSPPVGSGAGGSILYLENQSPTAIDPGLTVSDPDSTNFIGALVAISGNYQAGQDVLGFSNQNGISGSFDAAAGVLTLTGTSSVANYQTALGSVTYFNSSDDPSTAARTVDYQVNDGSGLVDIGTAGVTITAENDPPVITSDGGGDTTALSIAENTTAVTTVVASDPDSSVTYSIIGGSDAAKFQINAASGALSFITAPDFEIPGDSDHNNTYVVQVRAFDGSLADAQTITVSVADVSDPLPTLHWARSVDIGPHPAGWLPAGIGDFNGDATSDLAWFNATTGDVDIWKLANSQWAGSSDVGSHPAGYQPAGFGDFNHDGTSDILWFNATTRDVDLWKISNAQWAGSVDIGTHPAGYTPSGVGDFNNDGTSDVLWFNASTRDAEIWKISNGQWAGSVDIGTHPAGYQPALTGDFNGDGTSDIAWYNPTTGDLDIWKLADGHWAGSIDVGAHPAGWQPLGAADFNLDGTSDIAWINPTNNDIDVWLINNGHWAGSVDVGTHPGSAVAIGIGDFDHNGVNDILWRNPTDGHVESWMLAFS